MNDISHKVLSKIDEEAIKPIPRYLFVARSVAMSIIIIFSMIIGIISASLIMYNAANKDWDIYKYLDQSFFVFFVNSLPYVWIVLIISSLVITVVTLEHNRRGYRHSPWKISILAIVFALIIGLAVFVFGFGEKIDNYLGTKFSAYQTVESQKAAVWNQPSNGLFSGEIKSVGESSIELESYDGRVWQIDYAAAVIRNNVQIAIGSQVKIIGQLQGDKIIAEEIRPWGGSVSSQNKGNATNDGYGNGRGRVDK